jgi:hypothetical protein
MKTTNVILRNSLIVSIILIIQTLVVNPIFAQINIPDKLLKGITVSTDDFTKKTLYYNFSQLVIEQKKDSIKCDIVFQATTWDVPMDLQEIDVLTQDSLFVIKNQKFEVEEKYVKKIVDFNVSTEQHPFSTPDLNVSTNSVIRKLCTNIWIGNAKDYMPMINSMIKCKGYKVRFAGKNKTIDDDNDGKMAKKSKAILDLYQYIVNNSTLKH